MDLLKVCPIIDIWLDYVNCFQSETLQTPHIYDVFFGMLLAWQGANGLIKMQELVLALRNIFERFPDLETDWTHHVHRHLRVDSPDKIADFNAAWIAGGEFTTILLIRVDLLGELEHIDGNQGLLMLNHQEHNDSQPMSSTVERKDAMPHAPGGGTSSDSMAATVAVSSVEAAQKPKETGEGNIVSHAEAHSDRVNITERQATPAEVKPPTAGEFSPDLPGNLESPDFNNECTMRGGGENCTICDADLTPDHECSSAKSEKERQERILNRRQNSRQDQAGNRKDKKWRPPIFQETKSMMEVENGKDPKHCPRCGSQNISCNCCPSRAMNHRKRISPFQKKEKDATSMAGTALSSWPAGSSGSGPVEHRSRICQGESSKTSANQSSEEDLKCLGVGKCHWTNGIFYRCQHCTRLFFRSEPNSSLSSSPAWDDGESPTAMTTQPSTFASLGKSDKEAPNSSNTAPLLRRPSLGSLKSEISFLELTPMLGKMTIDAHNQKNQEEDDHSSRMQLDSKVSTRGGQLDEAEEMYLLPGTQAYGQARALLLDTIGSTRERKTPRIPRSSMLSSDQRAALGSTPLTLVPQERIRLSQRLSSADGKPLVFEHPPPSPRMDLNNTINDKSPVTLPEDGPPVACRQCSAKLRSPCPLCLPVATYNSSTGKGRQGHR